MNTLKVYIRLSHFESSTFGLTIYWLLRGNPILNHLCIDKTRWVKILNQDS